MRQLIEDLISTMEYHVEQTRPIHSTTVALQAARDALKSLPAQEPVAWMGAHDHTDLYYRKPPQADVIPLYTSPPAQRKPLPEDYTALEQALTSLQKRYADLEGRASKPWVGLTDEEKADLFEGTAPYYNETDYADAIEAKLREKNA